MDAAYVEQIGTGVTAADVFASQSLTLSTLNAQAQRQAALVIGQDGIVKMPFGSQSGSGSVVSMNSITDDGAGLDITSNSTDENENGIAITNNAGPFMITNNGSQSYAAFQINCNSSDEGNNSLRINAPTTNQAFGIDSTGDVIIGSSNGEQLVLVAQAQPVGGVQNGAMYFDSTTNLPYVWTGSSWGAVQVTTNPLIINSSNASSYFTAGSLVDGWIAIEQFQYFARFTFAVHISCGGTTIVALPYLAGLFNQQDASHTNWQIPLYAQPEAGQLWCDIDGNVTIGDLTEGTSQVNGSFDLPYNNLSF